MAQGLISGMSPIKPSDLSLGHANSAQIDFLATRSCPGEARRIVKVLFSDEAVKTIADKQVKQHVGKSHTFQKTDVPLTRPRNQRIIPLPCKQKLDIDLLVAQYAAEGFSAGSLWVVLSMRWWLLWRDCVSQELCQVDSINAIDNADIVFGRVDITEIGIDSYSNPSLRLGLEEGKDFTLLPWDAWEALHSWYGGGPAIIRQTDSSGCVDLWPKTLISLAQARALRSKFNLSRTHILGDHEEKVFLVSDKRMFSRVRTYSGTLAETDTLKIVYNDCGLSCVQVRQRQRQNQNSLESGNSGNSCFVCKNLALYHCCACRAVYYCSQSCQEAHWKYHRKWCKEAADHSRLPFEQFQAVVPVGFRGRVGLSNLGNSCYLNSSLQCLSHIKPLTLYFISNRYASEINDDNSFGTSGKLVREYASVMKDLWFESKRSLYPKPIRSLLGRLQPDWAGPGQQDAHEIVDFLLDKLHEDLNRIKRKPWTEKVEGNGLNDLEVATNEWIKHDMRENSIVKDLVGSQYRSQMECQDCKKVSVSFEYHQTVCLAIPRKTTRIIRVVVTPLTAPKVNVSLLNPTEYVITVERSNTFSEVKNELYKLLPSSIDAQGFELALLELDSRDHSLIRFFDDRHPVSLLADGGFAISYIMPRDVRANDIPNNEFRCFVMHRLVSAASSSVTEKRFEISSKGFPQEFRINPNTCSCRKIRMLIWRYVSRFVGASTPLGEALKVASSRGKVEELALYNVIVDSLPIRLVSRLGSGKFSAESYPEPDDVSISAGGAQYTSASYSYGVNTSYASSGDLGSVLPNSATLLFKEFTSNVKTRPYVFLAVDWIGSWLEMLDVAALMHISKHAMHPSALPQTTSYPKRIGSVNSSQGNHIGKFECLTLEDCLRQYTLEEHGQTWYCNACKCMKENAKKKLLFSDLHLPKILILTLKRFEHDATSPTAMFGRNEQAEKLDDYVDFPLEGLDLSPFCCKASSAELNAVYDLFAVCNHYGRMGFGHYTAYARDWLLSEKLSDQWVYYDDERVTLTSPAAIQTKHAYMLFYKRRGIV